MCIWKFLRENFLYDIFLNLTLYKIWKDSNCKDFIYMERYGKIVITILYKYKILVKKEVNKTLNFFF